MDPENMNMFPCLNNGNDKGGLVDTFACFRPLFLADQGLLQGHSEEVFKNKKRKYITAIKVN